MYDYSHYEIEELLDEFLTAYTEYCRFLFREDIIDWSLERENEACKKYLAIREEIKSRCGAV